MKCRRGLSPAQASGRNPWPVCTVITKDHWQFEGGRGERQGLWRAG